MCLSSGLILTLYPKQWWKGLLTGWWFQPLWKVWVRQLGLQFPIYGKIKFIFQTTNQLMSLLMLLLHVPISSYIPPIELRFGAVWIHHAPTSHPFAIASSLHVLRDPRAPSGQQLGDHLQGYGRLQKFMERISNFCSHSSLQHISIPWRSPWRKYVWNDDRHIPKSTHSGLSSDLEPQQPQRVTSPISWTEKQTSEKKTRKTTCWALNKTLSEVMWFKQSYGYHFQNFHFIINMCGFSRWYSINHSQWLVTMALFYRSSHGSPKVQVIPIMVKPQALPCPLVNWHN